MIQGETFQVNLQNNIDDGDLGEYKENDREKARTKQLSPRGTPVCVQRTGRRGTRGKQDPWISEVQIKINNKRTFTAEDAEKGSGERHEVKPTPSLAEHAKSAKKNQNRECDSP